jgi:hypothetical protein
MFKASNTTQVQMQETMTDQQAQLSKIGQILEQMAGGMNFGDGGSNAASPSPTRKQARRSARMNLTEEDEGMDESPGSQCSCTVTMATNRWSGRVSTSGKDPWGLGRFLYVGTQGKIVNKRQRKLMIITLYTEYAPTSQPTRQVPKRFIISKNGICSGTMEWRILTPEARLSTT